MYFVIPYWIDWTAPVLVFAFALLRGSAPERMLAAFCSVLYVYDHFVQPHGVGGMPLYELGESIALLLANLTLAMRFDRRWPLVTSMTSLLRVATCIAAFIMPLQSWTIGTAQWTWAWIALAALTTGTWRSSRTESPKRPVPESRAGAVVA